MTVRQDAPEVSDQLDGLVQRMSGVQSLAV
jgi:hypothetical protein